MQIFGTFFQREERVNIFMYILNVKLQENLPLTLNITDKIRKMTVLYKMPHILGRGTIAMNGDGSKMFIENICKQQSSDIRCV